MDDWDLETLAKVVESKGKEYNQNKPTDIVCKFFYRVFIFLDASLYQVIAIL